MNSLQERQHATKAIKPMKACKWEPVPKIVGPAEGISFAYSGRDQGFVVMRFSRVKTTLLAFLFLTALSQAGPPEPKQWRDLLTIPVDDDWQQLFSNPLLQHTPRPAEIFADKIIAIQALIAKSNKSGITIPVFLPPDLALKPFEAIPATPPGEGRTGVPLSHVPASELFRYIGSLLGCDVIETEHGIIFKRHQQP
jgi:hypothetical protein